MAKEKSIEIVFKTRVTHNGKTYKAGEKIKVAESEKKRWLKAGAKIVCIDEVAVGADGVGTAINESSENPEDKKNEGKVKTEPEE